MIRRRCFPWPYCRLRISAPTRSRNIGVWRSCGRTDLLAGADWAPSNDFAFFVLCVQGEAHGYFAKRVDYCPLTLFFEGSVRIEGGRVRMAAQLSQVSSGLHLWSGTMEREAHNAWAVQEEIARAIVAALNLKLTLRMGGSRRRLPKTVEPRELDRFHPSSSAPTSGCSSSPAD